MSWFNSNLYKEKWNFVNKQNPILLLLISNNE